MGRFDPELTWEEKPGAVVAAIPALSCRPILQWMWVAARSMEGQPGLLDLSSRFGCLLFEGVPGRRNQFVKSGGVSGSEVSQGLPIKGHLGRSQAFHETAVGHPGLPGSSIDADLPKSSKGALFRAAIAVGVLPSMINCIRRVTVKLRAAAAESFGGF
jgi:hypothetical protein